ncbi:MAG TPA: hypothetical protein VHR18_07115 [Solirubrobacterales bacterium]|jgi:hypothetical protein|nr:hypothetical protein [Solirubrobacterales bacterium]
MKDVEVEKVDSNVAVAKGAHGWLVGIGVGFIALFFVLIVFNRVVGTETKETATPAAQTTTTGTTTAEPQAVSKTTKTKGLPTETLLSALLGAGAALVLAGFLYARISSIKLPGSVEVSLTQKEKEDTAKKVAEALPDNTPNEVVAEKTVAATSRVEEAKAATVAEAPTAMIDAAVAHVTQ